MSQELDLEPAELFVALGAFLESKRAALRSKPVVSFAVEGHGCFVLDLGAPQILREGWEKKGDVCVLTNRKTLNDIAQGLFDPEHPAANHVFLCEGDRQAFSMVAEALSAGQSWLSLRASTQGEERE